MTLYEVERAIYECIDEETGEIIDFERLNQLDMEKQSKIDNIACWYKQLNAETEAINNEIEILKIRRQKKKDNAENLKNYLSEILGGKKFESSRAVITWRKSEEVKITDEDRLPAMLMREKVTFEADKKAIKEAIKSGQRIDGAYIEHKNNISIN